MASPQVLNTGVFVTVLRMLVIMCASCPDLAVMLLKHSKLLILFSVLVCKVKFKDLLQEHLTFCLYIMFQFIKSAVLIITIVSSLVLTWCDVIGSTIIHCEMLL